MITNARLTRIATEGPADAAGRRAVTTVTLPGSGVPGFLGDVTRAQRWTLENRVSEASATFVTLTSELAVAPTDGATLTIVLDEDAHRPLELQVVTTVSPRKAGGLSHHQIFLKEVKG